MGLPTAEEMKAVWTRLRDRQLLGIRLTDLVRAEISAIRERLSHGKGEYGHPRYVPDDVWHEWMQQKIMLENLLRKSGEKDGG